MGDDKTGDISETRRVDQSIDTTCYQLSATVDCDKHSRPRSVYLPLILISSQMNTEKCNMNIHFHVHQPRSSSKHVLTIQILSVRPFVRWYCIKTAERIVMIFSPHDNPFILVFTADARSVGNRLINVYLTSLMYIHSTVIQLLYGTNCHLIYCITCYSVTLWSVRQ